MIKVFTKIFLVIFFLLISFIGYLSLVGLETKRFNNQIKQSLKKIDSKIDIDAGSLYDGRINNPLFFKKLFIFLGGTLTFILTLSCKPLAFI